MHGIQYWLHSRSFPIILKLVIFFLIFCKQQDNQEHEISTKNLRPCEATTAFTPSGNSKRNVIYNCMMYVLLQWVVATHQFWPCVGFVPTFLASPSDAIINLPGPDVQGPGSNQQKFYLVVNFAWRQKGCQKYPCLPICHATTCRCI